MEHLYIHLNNVQTHLINYGNPFNCDGDVIVCVTGNPGMPDFYQEFGLALYQNSGLPVCIIGQAGHEEVPDENSNILENRENLFNLTGQIQHKLALLKMIDNKRQIHLIGHSIGSWIIIELLDNNENLFQRIKSINFLFPTIQKMAESQSAFFVNKICRNVHCLVMLGVRFAYLFPEIIKKTLISAYLKVYSLPAHYVERIYKLINPCVLEKILFLAYNEMDTVRMLNIECINKIKHFTNVIFTDKDGWVPLSYIDDLKSFQPSLKLQFSPVEHAFVLKSSDVIAEMVSKFIEGKK